jgi:hypothetical protein
MKSTIFWDTMLCSLLSVNRRFGGTYRLHHQGRKNKLSKKPAWKQVATCLKMEAICFFETSVNTQRTTRRYIPGDDSLQTNAIMWLLQLNPIPMYCLLLYWYERSCLLGYQFTLHKCSKCLICIGKVTAFPRPDYTILLSWLRRNNLNSPHNSNISTLLAADK